MGGLFADGGATLLEKLYICQDSDIGHGIGGGAGRDSGPRKGLWAWDGGMPLVNCVTLNSKSATRAPYLVCMCSWGGGEGNRSVSLGLISIQGLPLEGQLGGYESQLMAERL